jgi:23S rRNA (pseudouridine1915-N3)-methyltransferase
MQAMRWALFCIGKLKMRWAAEGCAMYTERLGNSLSITELPASRARDGDAQRTEESAAILRALMKWKGEVWVLDEGGERMTSTTFSSVLAKLGDRGTPVAFVLGGAFGLDASVRDRADLVLRLSDMTFPHELCRVVLLEQLYRASEIAKGTGYHHI